MSKGIRGQSLVAGYYESQGAGAGPSPPVADPHGRSGLRAAGWVFLSAGLACAVAGAVTGVMAIQAFDDERMNFCNSETGCPGVNDAARKDQLLLTTNLLFAGSNVLGAIGGAMLIVGILKEGGGSDVSLLPIGGPRHAGLVLSTSF